MTDIDILKQLQQIFVEVLDDEDIVLTPETKADDIEDWDSLTHINLVSATEKEFGLSFTLAELEALANVGDMIQLIQSRLA